MKVYHGAPRLKVRLRYGILRFMRKLTVRFADPDMDGLTRIANDNNVALAEVVRVAAQYAIRDHSSAVAQLLRGDTPDASAGVSTPARGVQPEQQAAARVAIDHIAKVAAVLPQCVHALASTHGMGSSARKCMELGNELAAVKSVLEVIAGDTTSRT